MTYLGWEVGVWSWGSTVPRTSLSWCHIPAALTRKHSISVCGMYEVRGDEGAKKEKEEREEKEGRREREERERDLKTKQMSYVSFSGEVLV